MSLPFVHSHDSSQHHTDNVWSTVWTAADTVISGSADGSTSLWNASDGQFIRSLSRHPLAIISISTDSRGSQALVNSLEGTTYLWDLNDGETIAKKESFTESQMGVEPAWSVSLNPQGGTYVSTGGSGVVSFHSADPSSFGKTLDTVAPRTDVKSKFGMFVSYSPDATRVALSTEPGQVYVFDVSKMVLVQTFTSHAACVRSLAWSSDSSLILSASDDKRLVLHDVRAGSGSTAGKLGSAAVAALTGHSSWVLSTSISADGKLAASGSADRTLKVWDIASRRCVSTASEQGDVWSVSWRPQGGVNLVSGSEEGAVKWWRGAGVGAPDM